MNRCDLYQEYGTEPFVEFIAPLKRATHQARVLAVLYFKERQESATNFDDWANSTGIEGFSISRRNKVNLADVLHKGGPFVDTIDAKGNGSGS